MSGLKVLFVGLQGLENWEEIECAAFFDGFDEIKHMNEENQTIMNLGYMMFNSLQEAVESFNPDLAVIDVPNNTKNRIEYEEYLLAKGINVLEKKLRVAAYDDFHKILKAAEKSTAKLFAGEFYRYNNCARTVKRKLEQGIIGKPQQLWWECFITGSDISPWEVHYRHLALEDLAYHHFGVIHYLLGIDAKTVYASSSSPLKGAPSTGTVSSTLIETRDGCRINHFINWHSLTKATDFFGNLSIEGERGGLLIENEKVYMTLVGGNKEELMLVDEVPKSTLSHVLSYMKDQNSHVERPWTVKDFVPVMITIDAAIRSAESGNVIHLL
jgi:predicted dehydrogenase